MYRTCSNRRRCLQNVHAMEQEPGGLEAWYRCGGNHPSAECRFKTSVCHACNKRGHLSRMCCTRKAQQQGRGAGTDATGKPSRGCRRGNKTSQTNAVEQEGMHPNNPSSESYILYPVLTQRVHPIQVSVKVARAHMDMEYILYKFQ